MIKSLEWLDYYKQIIIESNQTFRPNGFDLIEKELKALEIIKKYTYSGGWSGDYTTRYWDMKNNEIKVIDELFKDVPINALSDRK